MRVCFAQRTILDQRMSFENKVILITGASSGIGAACAEHFAKKGALLSLVGRNANNFAAVVDRIKQIRPKAKPLVILADVSVDHERIVNETIAKYGRLDVLVNNAGYGFPGGIATLKIEDYDGIMATNARAVLLITQLATPHLIASKGNVVNVSSVAGFRGFAGFLAYCMSKGALDQFTRCVALELAEGGVRVNSVNPAVIRTDFHARAGVARDNAAASHPIGRVGDSEEVAALIAYLAGEDAGFITGTCLPIDGGISIKTAIGRIESFFLVSSTVDRYVVPPVYFIII